MALLSLFLHAVQQHFTRFSAAYDSPHARWIWQTVLRMETWVELGGLGLPGILSSGVAWRSAHLVSSRSNS